jgi:hypothetical protein
VLSGVCHCDDCKKRTGSAFGFSAYFPQKEVQAVIGEFVSYKVNAAAGRQERHFCERCGTTLYWTSEPIKNCIGIAGGCFIETPLPAPEFVAQVENQCHWLTLANSIKTELRTSDIPQVGL